jgi:hypothetical protein
MKRIGIIATIITIMLLSVAFVSANEAPVLTVSSCATKAVEDETYTCTVTSTDADTGDVPTYSLTTKPEGMTINSATGAITWTPNDEQIGSHTVTVKVTDDDTTPLTDEETFTIFARPEGVCGDYESGTDIKITDLEITDDDEDFYPGSEIEITVDVENDGNDDLEDIVVEAVLYDVTDGKKLDSIQTDAFDLDEDEDTTAELTIEVPKEIDEGNTIILFVSAYEDGNDDENCDYEYDNNLDFNRRKHDITVNTLTDSALTVKPGKTVEVRFDIENVGARDEEGVYITLKNAELGINKKSEAFDIDAYEKGDDDEYTITMILSVLANAKPGDYELEINVYNEDGKVYSSGLGFLTLTVEGTTTSVTQTTTTGAATITVEGLPETVETGKSLSIPVKVTNTAGTDKEYKILLTNIADWAESTSVIDAYLTSGQTSTYYLTLVPKTDATEGQHSATVNVKEGTTTVTTKTLSFTTPEKTDSITGGTVIGVEDKGAFQNVFGGTTFWIIGDLVLVIVGIFFIKMLFTKKETE